jgi:7-carboxy-7-deazaguanine synthase
VRRERLTRFLMPPTDIPLSTDNIAQYPSVNHATHLRVSEQFISIQGEGLDIGQPFSFIRLFGCNYYCSWCDTKYAVQHWSDTYEERTPAELGAWASAQGNRAVCLTGGEPLTAPKGLFLELVRLLKANDHYLDIQTNGTIFRAELAPLIDSWSISPKLGSSGMAERPDVLRCYLAARADGTLLGRLLFKFVIANESDLRLTKDLLESIPEIASQRVPIILQPEGLSRADVAAYAASLRWLAETVAIGPDAAQWHSYDLRVLPQVHRIIWGGKQGI